MKLKLNEIPHEGLEYVLTNKTAELNADLKDLVGSNDYEIQFFIKPLNHRDFELKGTLKAHTVETCSLCGDTFNFPVKAKLHEILLPATPLDKMDKQARSNHFSELDQDGPSVTEYENDQIDLGEFSHQAIALNVPYSPKPEMKENGDCSVCLKVQMNTPFKYEDDMTKFEAEKKKENPFNVLKNVKLN